MRSPRDIIIKPIVTEKSIGQMEDKKYSFVVNKKANKVLLKAVEDIDVRVKRQYDVGQGKARRVVCRGYRPDWKKLLLPCMKKEPIEIYE